MSLFWRRGEQRSGDWSDVNPSRRKRTVTPENATYLAPVFSSFRHIVDYLSTLPVDAFRRGTGGARTETDLPAVLASQDKLGMPGLGNWLGQAAFGLVAHGNAVGYVDETDDQGDPALTHWLDRTDWQFDEQTKQWRLNGAPVPASRILHIPWIVPPGKTLGLSPIEHFAEIVRAGLSAQEYADVGRGGGVPPTHLKNTAKVLDPEQSERIRERAHRAFEANEPFVTGSDWDLSISAIPPSHAQFLETLKLSSTQVAAIYGIDPREIGGEAPNSLDYTNNESRARDRAANLDPYIVRIENAIQRILPSGQYVKLNTDARIRADIKTRVAVIGEQIKDGRMSVNEARALEDRKPVPGGDYHNVPTPTAEPANREGDTP